jgi:hypothetical protein
MKMNANRLAIMTMSIALVAGCDTNPTATVQGHALAEAGPGTVMPDGSNERDCRGMIAGLQDGGFNRDGELLTIAAIAGGECAPIYNPATRETLGSVAVGDVVIGCDFTEDHPARLHVAKPLKADSWDNYVVGDVNYSPEGLQQAQTISNLPSCDEVGAQDLGFVRRTYTFISTPQPGTLLQVS